jgi:hypothetical protein
MTTAFPRRKPTHHDPRRFQVLLPRARFAANLPPTPPRPPPTSCGATGDQLRDRHGYADTLWYGSRKRPGAAHLQHGRTTRPPKRCTCTIPTWPPSYSMSRLARGLRRGARRTARNCNEVHHRYWHPGAGRRLVQAYLTEVGMEVDPQQLGTRRRRPRIWRASTTSRASISHTPIRSC